MGLGKKDIIKNISSRTQLSNLETSALLEFFLVTLKRNINHIKLSRFGTFTLHITPERLGRNPKTLEEFIIPKKERVSFKPSNTIKNFIN